jgi:hypothetical protein
MSSSLSPSPARGQHHLKLVPQRAGLGENLTFACRHARVAWASCEKRTCSPLCASILNICVKTVESHRTAVMRKLELCSAADLVRYAIRNGLAEA